MMKVISNLGGQFETCAVNQGPSNFMPEPLADLILDASHPFPAATYKLLEGSLRYYPLQLDSFQRGDKLRAYFNCQTKDNLVSVRFDRDELNREEKLLRLFADQTIADWNLMQIRTAKILMETVPVEQRLSPGILESFRASPREFYAAINSRPAPEIH